MDIKGTDRFRHNNSGRVKTPISSTEKSPRQKINKETSELN
jgi:hypothetical protein